LHPQWGGRVDRDTILSTLSTLHEGRHDWESPMPVLSWNWLPD